MNLKHFFSFGIENGHVRLAFWFGCWGASSLLMLVWWPYALVPFGLLLGKALHATWSARDEL